MDRPSSASRCSSQSRARCSTGLWRERRWQNSATNELESGTLARARSATTTTRWDGCCSVMSCRRSTHKSARSRSARAMVSRATRVSGVADDRPLELRELLMMCDALCAEGGSIQRVAEEIAMRALRES